ncbi:flagellar hook-associated protein 2 [Bacillus tianshenii]|uniref:Flagellar hook-associated protein 2 n=1 Tax=Sutcliffiella tianshenii TaxID=1463404 RepID=A0ABS2NVB1_9BACI|nr:flagellar hook-associated protein 2 [Bacillus tianshenii]MBM7618358.1 flagellar hook-associated protein 2 [Bacillus tianshenii]
MRISGFASGMDIDTIVKDLMKAERMPMNKLTQQKQLLEWKRDDYRELNKLLTDFRNLSFDMTLQRTYSQKQVTTSNTKVSAVASSTAGNGSYTISNVQLATASSKSSSGIITDRASFDSDKSIWEQRDLFNNWTTNTSSTYAGGELESKTGFIQLDGLVDVNKMPNTITGQRMVDGSLTSFTYNLGEDVTLDEKSGRLVFKEPLEAGSTIQGFTYENYQSTLSITTYDETGRELKGEFTLTGSKTMNQLMSEISSSPIGVTAFYDDYSGELKMTRKDAGALVGVDGKSFAISDGFFKDYLKLDDTEQTGQSATLDINGISTTRKSNTFSINGVTITLKEDMPETATITVNNDSEKTFGAIKNYIEKYNELITKISEKTSQAVYRDFKPLTDEERESLSEKQIEQWEEKAKSGLLKNDSILTSGLGKMRSNFYEPLAGASGVFNQLAQIGITTSVNYRDGGKLNINEEKLRQAIEKDPSSVMELFTATGSDNSSQGLARRLRESVGATIQQIEARAGNTSRNNQQFTIGRELLNVDKRISTFEMRLQQKESRYWRQFTAMEKAINISNNQSMQLMSQFYNNG